MYRISTCLTALLCMALSQTAGAKIAYPALVPNGLTNTCLTCHTSPTGGTDDDMKLNVFGVDSQAVLTDGVLDWDALCDLDSDSDGLTNGLELGDSDCTWQVGDDNPGTTEDVSLPGDETSPGNTDAPGPSPGEPGMPTDSDGGGCRAADAPVSAALALLLVCLTIGRRRRWDPPS